jgi:hypothetical protein
MTRLKKFSLRMVVMIAMALSMSSLALAQQETLPDQFQSADDISSAQAAAQPKPKDNAQVANSQRQTKARKQKQLAKHNATQPQNAVIAQR